jgi:hypothetical protein
MGPNKAAGTNQSIMLSEAAEATLAAIEAQVSADVSEDNVGAISLGVVGPGGTTELPLSLRFLSEFRAVEKVHGRSFAVDCTQRPMAALLTRTAAALACVRLDTQGLRWRGVGAKP